MLMKIAIAKAMGEIEVDTDLIDPDVLLLIYSEGLKTLLNSKMSKMATPKAIKETMSEEDGAKAKAAALSKAEENLAKIYDGSFKKVSRGSASDTKVPRELKTEAMRIARNVIRDSIRAEGGKISHYKASDITAAAEDVLNGEEGPGIWAEAKTNLEARKTAPVKKSVLGSLKADPELVRKAEEKKVKAKVDRANAGPISAAQAGKVRRRQTEVVH